MCSSCSPRNRPFFPQQLNPKYQHTIKNENNQNNRGLACRQAGIARSAELGLPIFGVALSVHRSFSVGEEPILRVWKVNLLFLRNRKSRRSTHDASSRWYFGGYASAPMHGPWQTGQSARDTWALVGANPAECASSFSFFMESRHLYEQLH
jgi:hypothetical protein